MPRLRIAPGTRHRQWQKWYPIWGSRASKSIPYWSVHAYPARSRLLPFKSRFCDSACDVSSWLCSDQILLRRRKKYSAKGISITNFSSERVDSKGLYGRWRLQVIGSWSSPKCKYPIHPPPWALEYKTTKFARHFENHRCMTWRHTGSDQWTNVYPRDGPSLLQHTYFPLAEQTVLAYHEIP